MNIFRGSSGLELFGKEIDALGEGIAAEVDSERVFDYD